MAEASASLNELRKRTLNTYGPESAVCSVNPPLPDEARMTLLRMKYESEYKLANNLSSFIEEATHKQNGEILKTAPKPVENKTEEARDKWGDSFERSVGNENQSMTETVSNGISESLHKDTKELNFSTSTTLVVPEDRQTAILEVNKALPAAGASRVRAVRNRALQQMVQGQRSFGPVEGVEKDRPQWHPPWKLMRVISAHYGWVRSLAFDVTNEWFCSGSADRTIKFWDFASGELKLTLTGHIGTVRGLVVSHRHPYLFSVGDDKQVKCWDLEYNKVIRHYHGHLSGVYCVSLHPTLDVLVTGGRDSTVRIWDVRTKQQIFALSGHRDAIYSVQTQGVDPQVVSSSADATIKLWDLSAGRCFSTLTHHKKGVRSICIHPREFSFASASAGRIKTFLFPNGELLRNFYGHNTIVNSLAINEDDVLVSAGDDGSLVFWDYGAAHEFFRTNTIGQPGSLESETGIFTCCFDQTGSRLVTGEADKTIKVWKEDENATEETHPIHWQPPSGLRRY
ncbi:hypothetical protein GpartN1_g5074.t1 [Galdieria partita]|uniref:Pleiotropic regulator 1 n=1 Tax=Galdieria partita TaxID=83374 RepID=A0A9C7URY0_9RHOD|nr:hypothetical protein GpartN1_g5074.t1 [Galdieria partita]